MTFSNRSNLKRHEAQQHDKEGQPIICIDDKNGIFVTPKDAYGPRVAIHVCKSILSQSLACEVPLCRDYMKIGLESGNPGIECQHLHRTNRAIPYSQPPVLRLDSLQLMVDRGLVSTSQKDECVGLNSKSLSVGADSVFPIFWGEHGLSERYVYFSVFTGMKDNWCQFGRTRVTFDSQTGQWHCQCRNKIRKCVHRYISMWWIFQERRNLLHAEMDPSAEEIDDIEERVRESEDTRRDVSKGPSVDVCQLTEYIWRQKRIPGELDVELSKTEKKVPQFFEPVETNCPYCPGPSPPALGEKTLVTNHGTVYGISTVIKDVPVYIRECPVCRCPVRFQEYWSGFHNYNNKVFLTIPLCSLLTSGLSNHIAVGRFLHTLEDHANLKVPHNVIRRAFYHFSALRNYSYSYSCNRCGHNPPVLIADANWKIAFNLPVHLFRRPNLENSKLEDTQVNVRTRWEMLEKRIVASGFCDGKKNLELSVNIVYK
ncbi:uncharacterized protein LOC143485752 [Brachyhypopomus gauderio]|uniref:uncharacterized protein LOC143485752 n=1 Tax=Brachyhypopomus gauderio TaxID=698409 RepID=UPI004041220F